MTTPTILRSRSMFTMRPELRPWIDGQSIKMGNWAMRDGWRDSSTKVRYVYHYTTLMGWFEQQQNDSWTFEPYSIGHGSASDQHGMNKIMSARYFTPTRTMLTNYGWYYSRRGGARYVETA